MRLRLLGPLELCDEEGRAVAVAGRKERALLAALALSANKVVSEDALIYLLWGQESPDGAVASMRSFASRLRRVLPRGASLDFRSPGYVLTLPEGCLDLDTVEARRGEAATATESGDHERAASCLAAALSEWRGPVLPDLSDHGRAEVTRLDGIRLRVEEEHAEALLAAGRPGDVLEALDRLCAEHPYRESLWRLRMTALYRAGRQADALRAYDQLRRALADELGIDPAPETRALEAQLLAQDALLEATGATTPTWSGAEPRPLFEHLPEGVVTFLLTDIEGSTRLWEERSEQMGLVLARHDALIEQAVAEAGGRLLKTRGEGDSTFSVFHRASDAVSAAIEVQRALAKEPWPEGIDLRVRAALHSGEVALDDGDYRGRAVNRAARLRGLGHGGQTVLSDITAGLTRDSLGAEASLRPLGLHRLRDLPEPEEIFQLCHPDLPLDFPPLRSLDDVRHNLPASQTSFVGRDAELAEVREQLAGHRMVTLVGAGGAGKTRLAIETARSLVGSYAAGPWLVELAPIGDPDLVADAVADAVGLSGRGAAGLDPTDRLAAHLGGVATAIVLDNCEQVVGACAALVDRLLRACPELRVLATSREPLGVSGEVSYRVPSLEIPPDGAEIKHRLGAPAARLFADRAASARPGFELDESNIDAVSSICRQLDGIPLALELAAALVRALPLDEVAKRLDDRFRLLRAGTRTALPRQQTLQALVDWSHQLLSEPERLAWRRLSACSGGFSIEAAEAICVDEAGGLTSADVLDLVFRLVDKSIVTTDSTGDETRFRMNETVRLFGRDRLVESGEAAAVYDRHLDWVGALAREAGPHLVQRDQRRWLERLETEAANIRSAVGWGIDSSPQVALAMASLLWRYWEGTGGLREGAEYLQRAIDAAPQLSTAAVEAWHGLGVLLARADRHDEARAAFERCGQVAEELGDRRGVGIADWGAAFVAYDYWDSGIEEYLAAARRSVAVFREIGDDTMLARALFTMGNVLRRAGEAAAAREAYEETARVGRACGHLVMEAFAENNLGLEADHAGEPLAARDLFERSFRRFVASGNRYGIVTVGSNAAHMAASLGDRTLATEVVAVVKPVVWHMRYAKTIAHSACWSANRFVEAGWLDLARELLHAVVPVARTTASDELFGATSAIEGRALLEEGNRAAAAAALAEAAERFVGVRDPELLYPLVELAAGLGHSTLADRVRAMPDQSEDGDGSREREVVLQELARAARADLSARQPSHNRATTPDP